MKLSFILLPSFIDKLLLLFVFEWFEYTYPEVLQLLFINIPSSRRLTAWCHFYSFVRITTIYRTKHRCYLLSSKTIIISNGQAKREKK